MPPWDYAITFHDRMIEERDGGIVVAFKVIPRSKKNRIGEQLGDFIKLHIKAPPVDNKANEEIVSFLSEKMGLRKADVSILQGATGQRKKVFLRTTINSFKAKMID